MAEEKIYKSCYSGEEIDYRLGREFSSVAFSGKYTDIEGAPIIESVISEDSENPVSSAGIYNYVNSSIATETSYFRGTFNSKAELDAYSGELTNNDYAFVKTTDGAGNTLYNRYKYNGNSWEFEYALNNSSFTAVQWSAINSGITKQAVENFNSHTQNMNNPHNVSKQDLGLNYVENKSSAMIRSELTDANITDALGFTPSKASDLFSKVDKVEGKGLSSEDFTSEEKAQLAELSNYADITSEDIDGIFDSYSENT